MQEQRERSRAGIAGDGADGIGEKAVAVAKEAAPTEFVGWDETAADTRVTALEDLGDGTALVKLERSPFYPEGGGQVSDTGVIAGGRGRGRVEEAYRTGSDQVLRVRLEEGDLPVGAEVTATVDGPRRRQTQANHTATHVLNWALRETLGQGVRQAGSYVGPDKLRFDFTHRGRIDPETLERIERMVNARVDEDQPVAGRSWTARTPPTSAPSACSRRSTASACACCPPATSRRSSAAAPTCRAPGRSVRS